ncbi:hypothetical protein EW145_g61 [Phellinidium pouzarii]|uniref:Serine/threonine-protein kinase haspin C-terminal domain-containing protein n=1 Tax=Phellinidium pouzarii TaxID=167371 RepID=A0A4S4LK49_9AGAM|nr:hypothetical protein EW145_g61 [Phellinidium pouzarii]
MFSTRTKKVTSYGRRAQRFVQVSDDRWHSSSISAETKQSENTVDLVADPEEKENVYVFPPVRTHRLTTASRNNCQRFNLSPGTQERTGKTYAKKIPNRQPLSDYQTNVPKSPAVPPKSSKPRASNAKGTPSTLRKVSTTSPYVDVEIIVLDDAGGRLIQEKRVSKTNEGDVDPDYRPTVKEAKRRRSMSKPTTKSPRATQYVQNSRVSGPALPARSSFDDELRPLRRPQISKKATHVIVLSDSDSEQDTTSSLYQTIASKAKKKSSTPSTPIDDAPSAAQPNMAAKSRKYKHNKHQVEVTIKSSSRSSIISSDVARRTVREKEMQSSFKHIPATQGCISDSDSSLLRPRQLTPIKPSRPTASSFQYRSKKSSPSKALAFSEDDDSSSIDEELKLALKVADLQLSGTLSLHATEPIAAAASVARPQHGSKVPSGIQSSTQRSQNPSYLRPLLSECGQIVPFDFSTLIETFPADPIINFSECTGFSKNVNGENLSSSFQKVGEASYSEVFGIGNVVLKVVPLLDEESDLSATWTAEWDSPPVSEVKDVLKEILITRAMGEICKGFIKLLKAHVVHGSYPPSLLELWDEYDGKKGSESIRPDHFSENQAYAIIILPNDGGSGWKQACSIFWQVTRSLGRAEELAHFEHRDLHWGQILVRESQKSLRLPAMVPSGFVCMDDLSHGVQSTIIDLGLARIDHGHGDAYWTPFTEEIFEGEGDYQYDVYRMMRKCNKNEWRSFRPFTNVLWLHYLADKLINHKQIHPPSLRASGKSSRKSVRSDAGSAALFEADKRAYNCLVEIEKILGCAAASVAHSVARRNTMALPHALQNSMLPTELEFIASDELIEIRPTVKMEKIRFISSWFDTSELPVCVRLLLSQGLYGPFVGGRLTKVPLWIAVNLKLKRKCNVVPPGWLNVGASSAHSDDINDENGLIVDTEFLQDKLSMETDPRLQNEFVGFPFRYAEIAKVLLDVASDNLDQPDKLRTLLKDIRETRQSKIRDNLERLDYRSLQMKGICAMEINESDGRRGSTCLCLISINIASATPTPRSGPDPSLAVSVELNGQTFVNKGLVAFGLIPSNFIESTGDTLGGIGSAIAVKRNTFRKLQDGTFSGTLVVQPDRGFNMYLIRSIFYEINLTLNSDFPSPSSDGTVNYQGRQHNIDFVLNPYYGVANLTFTEAQETLNLTYRDTLLYWDHFHTKTSGLDALAIRKQEIGFPSVAPSDPPMPIPFEFNHLTLDLEGLVLNADGTFWVGDEYGPYIYRFTSTGQLLQTIQPPQAILPFIDGTLNFTSETDPTTGRAGNQGFEGLTVTSDGNTLYALLQSATIQDGGSSKTTSRYTRMLKYDVSNAFLVRPKLVGEWVVPLPQSSKNKTRAQSETHFISENVFIVLARDGNGNGDSTTKSSYKQADLIDISQATDIHDTKFDSPANPISLNGTLDASITPATYVPFVDFINSTQLARFGLHNGDPIDPTLIDAKWESLALAPCEDAASPDDYFLFTASDNDFLTTQGRFDGQSFNGGMDVDNQFMVFRVTLPSVRKGSVEQSIEV